jgi:hypothetical protein
MFQTTVLTKNQKEKRQMGQMWGEGLAIEFTRTISKYCARRSKPEEILNIARSRIAITQMEAISESQIEKFKQTKDIAELGFIGEQFKKVETLRQEPYFGTPIEDQEIIECNLNVLRDRQSNLASAVEITVHELGKTNEKRDSTQEVDEDWIFRWQDYASQVSNKKIQELWGRIAANEFVTPGRYSLRVLEFLKTLSHDEAVLISKVGSFAISNTILSFSEPLLIQNKIEFRDLLHLQDIGILSNHNFNSIQSQIRASEGDTEFSHDFDYFDLTIHVKSSNLSTVIQTPLIAFTKLGEDVLSLADIQSNKDNLDLFIEFLNVRNLEFTIKSGKSIFDAESELKE